MDEICIMVEIDNGNQHIDSVSKLYCLLVSHIDISQNMIKPTV